MNKKRNTEPYTADEMDIPHPQRKELLTLHNTSYEMHHDSGLIGARKLPKSHKTNPRLKIKHRIFAARQSANNILIQLGKFSVTVREHLLKLRRKTDEIT